MELKNKFKFKLNEKKRWVKEHRQLDRAVTSTDPDPLHTKENKRAELQKRKACDI